MRKELAPAPVLWWQSASLPSMYCGLPLWATAVGNCALGSLPLALRLHWQLCPGDPLRPIPPESLWQCLAPICKPQEGVRGKFTSQRN